MGEIIKLRWWFCPECWLIRPRSPGDAGFVCPNCRPKRDMEPIQVTGKP